MKTKWIIDCKTRFRGIGLAAIMAWATLMAATLSNAQTTPANLSPDLQSVVKLSQAHMTDDVIINFIKNSGKVYTLSADDMIYLNSQGISQPVVNALLQTKASAPAPDSAPPPVAPPLSAPPPVAAPTPAPPPGLMDAFNSDASLNPSVWMMQTPLLQSLAQWNGAGLMPPMLAFSPAGMQMSGVNGPGQFTGVQSVAAFAPPFSFTATVSGLAPEGIPFDVYLVSADLRQWISVAGHLGGAGGGPRGGIGIASPFGGVRVPFGHGPSPEYGIWVNWTGSGQPIAALGNRIYPMPAPSVPYTVTVNIDPTGLASVSLQDPSGLSLGALNAMPVGPGPFNVVLAARKMGPTFANWQSVQLTPQGAPPPAVAMTAPPEVPTLDYFQAHLTPYGQWVDVPDVGAAWIPGEANNPDWRPYMDAGHWEYTDAGWFWQSDYPWGDIAFHYGRWINNGFTGGRWAWVPAYDWAPSWVAWREGAGGMGWAPLPWGVEFHAGLGLYWHGALVVDGVGFGLGFDAFVFVGPDHFWGGDYHHYAFDRERAREFYGHSEFHAGYRMEGGHLRAEGLGRDHMREITHHEIVEHRATEMRRTEEHQNFARRTEEHHEVLASHQASHPGAPGARPGSEPGRTTAAAPGHTPAYEQPGRTPASGPGNPGKAPPGKLPAGGGKPSPAPGKKPD